MQHALTGRPVLEYAQPIGQRQRPLHAQLVVSEVLAPCAMTPSRSVSLPALHGAIQALLADGELNRLRARYR